MVKELAEGGNHFAEEGPKIGRGERPPLEPALFQAAMLKGLGMLMDAAALSIAERVADRKLRRMAG